MVSRGLEAERVDVRRQIEVVVDRLRHMDDADAAGGLLRQAVRRVRRVVAAHRDQLRDAETPQRHDRLLEARVVACRIGARDADMRAAPEVNAADRLDGEGRDVIDVAVHDPLEPVADADDVDARQPSPDRGRADDAVDTGGRSPGHEDRQFVFRHRTADYYSAEAISSEDDDRSSLVTDGTGLAAKRSAVSDATTAGSASAPPSVGVIAARSSARLLVNPD